MQHLPPTLIEEFELQVKLGVVLGIQWNSEIEDNEWLVKWKGLHDNKATWEFVYSMNQQYPASQLVDKVNVDPNGIVRLPITHTY